MKVTPIAFTALTYASEDWLPIDLDATEMDNLAEFAGRACYQSWNRPNPKTAKNQGYLKNIMDQGHYSVLEHASISFYVEGVSRSLLMELERHRFLSFSVISQRYVKQNKRDVVVPPAIDDLLDKTAEYGLDELVKFDDLFQDAIDHSFEAYDRLSRCLMDKGVPRKQALEAARSVLPNATEVKMVVTGNIRAWRDVIGKRYHVAADAEIREFAGEILSNLREYSPNSVQDIPEVPYA